MPPQLHMYVAQPCYCSLHIEPMWGGLYVDYNVDTVLCSATYLHSMGGIFVQGHMLMMGNIPVLLVTLLIVVNLYVVYILT